MNTNKSLIIQLLTANMKHEQLIAGIRSLGFESELHSFDLSGVVLELMGRPEAEMSWEWFDMYMEHLAKAPLYEITATGENLLPLAESCYIYLQVQLEMEKGS